MRHGDVGQAGAQLYEVIAAAPRCQCPLQQTPQRMQWGRQALPCDSQPCRTPAFSISQIRSGQECFEVELQHPNDELEHPKQAAPSGDSMRAVPGRCE